MDNFLQHVFDLGKLKDLDKIKDPTLKSIVIGLKKKNKQKIKLSSKKKTENDVSIKLNDKIEMLT